MDPPKENEKKGKGGLKAGINLEDVDDLELSDSEKLSREFNELPVDRGYAWVICFSGFLCYFLFGVGNQPVVLLFLDILSLHEVTITVGSLIFLLMVLSISISNMITTHFIVKRIGERSVVICAGFLDAASSVGYYLAPNFGVFLFCTVLKGLSLGAVFVTSVSLLRHYFHHRRSVANTIANVGQCVAVMIVPPIVNVIRAQYGIRNVFLFMAAIELHMVFAGMLMRPISAYKYRPKLTPLKRKGFGKSKKDSSAFSAANNDQNKLEIQITNGSSRPNTLSDVEAKEALLEVRPNNTRNAKHEDHDQTDMAIGRRPDGSDYDSVAPISASMLSLVSNADGVILADLQVDIEEESAKTPEKAGSSGMCGSNSILSLWQMRMALIATVPWSVNLYMKNYIPTIALTQGATADQAALVLTIVGGVDLVQRILLGILADTHILKPSQIIIIGGLCIGILCQFVRFFTTFPTLVLMGVFLGLLLGVRISMMALLGLEVAGLERMPQAFSLLASLGAISSSCMNPLFGAVVQATGDFILVMHIVGACFIVGAVLMLPLPLLARVDKRRAEQRR